MKSIIFTLLLLVVSFCDVLAQRQEVTYQYNDYLDTLNVWQNQKNPFKNSRSFDTKGLLVKDIFGSSNYGVPTKYSEVLYNYNTKGQKIKRELYSRNIESPSVNWFINKETEEWTFNEFDSVATYNFSRFDYDRNINVLQGKDRFEYDTQKRLSSFVYSQIGEVNKEQVDIYRVKYQYDSKNRIIEMNFESTSSNYKYKNEYVYDANGNKIQQSTTYFISSKNIWLKTDRIDNEFDAKNNLIATTSFYIDNNISQDSLIKNIRQEFQYDDKNREVFKRSLLYKQKYKPFLVTDKTKTEYNKDGFLAKKSFVYLESELDLGNYSDDSTNQIVTIQYYPNGKQKEILSEFRTKEFRRKNKYFATYRTRYEYETSNSAEETDYFKNYIVFPNPATNKITVDNTLKDECLQSVNLYDISGHLIMALNKKESPFCTWEIELPPTLQKGMYVLFMTAYNGKTTGRQVFIQR
jgi:Secretion system C-terminal sorting domain